jgi:dihydrofolate reductase
VASAVAKARAVAGDKTVSVAGDKTVSVAGGPNLIQQCVREGLLDAINLSLVPVLLGDGIRFFGSLTDTPPWSRRPRYSPAVSRPDRIM